ncbi:ImmA/IrrE family metallo-endopeptidase [Fundicoccus ignavus]|uniref:ImmA/IrrE family metallo-endopeptidase n=1 Tax=Fundicoccus ignavus TaxID=2664442 RepID=UPI00129D0310|nr:ImmA/IrrE family metallo-endopeptidase [Fundicoccus ignavus]
MTEDRSEYLRRFTLIHECAHSILHRPYFSRCDNQLTLFELEDANDRSHAPLTAAMTSSYNGKGPRNFQSDHDWIEWQANSLASCLLMNKSSLSNLLEDYDLEDCSSLQKAVIVNQISDTYEVSYDAARVRFERFTRDYLNEGSLF